MICRDEKGLSNDGDGGMGNMGNMGDIGVEISTSVSSSASATLLKRDMKTKEVGTETCENQVISNIRGFNAHLGSESGSIGFIMSIHRSRDDWAEPQTSNLRTLRI